MNWEILMVGVALVSLLSSGGMWYIWRERPAERSAEPPVVASASLSPEHHAEVATC